MITISWKKFELDVRKLARHISFKPNVIVAISRGGVVVGCLLSHVMKKPMAVIAAQSYKGKKRGRISVGVFSSAVPIAGTVLLVDDLVDSGATMSEIKKRLLKMKKVRRVKTAVVYVKPGSAFKPDYAVRKLGQWVVFPYEK
ncbi:MAG: phosphoribosyltransferase family protein [Patescibacteria group bacterium]